MAKLLYYDFETSTLDVLQRTYSLKNYTKYFSHKNIVRDWTIFSCAWSYIGDNRVHCVSIKPSDPLNDEGVIRHMHTVLSDADILIGHNSDRFDIKKFNARAMYYGLPPIIRKPSETVDTLKVARKAGGFTSNSLDYLCKYLGIPQEKMKSPDWDKVLEGDAEEIRYMRQYNKGDIICGKELYKRLLPADDRHPNVSNLINARDTNGEYVQLCPKCGSPNWINNGHKISANKTKMKQQIYCKACGSYSTVGKWITKINLKGLING